MMKTTIYLFALLIMAMFMPAVMAPYQWYSPAGAGLIGGDYESQLTAYGINLNNILSNITNASYVSCLIGVSAHEPIALDSVLSTYSHILTYSANAIQVYDRNCAAIQVIPISENIRSAPNVVNWDESAILQFIVPLSHGLARYQWSDAQQQYLLQETITNNSIAGISYMACPLLKTYCLAFNATGGQAYLFNHTSGTAKAVSPLIGTNNNMIITGMEGLSNLMSPLQVPYCFLGELNGGTHFQCDIYNGAGAILYTPDFGSVTYSPYRLAYISGFYAQIGALTKLFFSGRGYDAPSGNAKYFWQNAISDGVSTTHYSNIIQMAANSNRSAWGWAVADINKDGYNEACYMRKVGADTYLTCIDATMATFLNLNVTGVMSGNNMVIADFVPGSSYQSIGTYEGIFSLNGTSIASWWSSGRSGSVDGHPIIYKDGAGVAPPLMIYVDSSIGFIVKVTAVGALCGNGDCDLGENPFTCPADCNASQSGPGSFGDNVPAANATDCASGYREYGKCALRPGKMACALNGQCLSQSCIGGLCTMPNLWDGIAYSKMQQFGGGTNTNNFISLFFMFGVAVGLILMGSGSAPSVLGGGVSFIALAVFFAAVGWLSPWILIGVFLITLIIGIILVMMVKG